MNRVKGIILIGLISLTGCQGEGSPQSTIGRVEPVSTIPATWTPIPPIETPEPEPTAIAVQPTATAFPTQPALLPTTSDNLPEFAIARFGNGHINMKELSADGAFIAIGSSIGIRVVNGITFEDIWLHSTGEEVNVIAISPDSTLVAGAVRHEVFVWELSTGEHVAWFGDLSGIAKALAWSPDSERLFAGGWLPYDTNCDDGFNGALVWNVRNQEILHCLDHSQTSYTSIEPLDLAIWSDDDRIIAGGGHSHGGGWIIWDASSGETLLFPTDGTERTPPQNIKLHPDGTKLAVTYGRISADTGRVFNYVKVWNTDSGQLLHTLSIEEDFTSGWPDTSIVSIEWSPRGRFLTTSETQAYSHAVIWNSETGEIVRELSLPDEETFITHTEWSPYSPLLASNIWYFDGTEDDPHSNEVYETIVWNFQSGEIEERISGTYQVRWIEDGSYQLVDELDSLNSSGIVNSVEWSPIGVQVAYSTDDQIVLRNLINDATTAIEFPRSTFEYSPDGDYLAVVHYELGNILLHRLDATSYLFDTVSVVPENQEYRHFRDLEWSVDGSIIAVAFETYTIFYDAITLEKVDVIENFGSQVIWTSDPDELFGLSLPRAFQFELSVLNLNKMEIDLSYNMPDHNDIEKVSLLSIHRDSILGRVGTGWYPDISTLFQVKPSETSDSLAYQEIISSVDFVFTDAEWLVEDKWLVFSTGTPFYGMGHVVGEYNGTIAILDVTTGEILHILEGHTAEVQGLAISPDGTMLASASADGTVILWDVEAILGQ